MENNSSLDKFLDFFWTFKLNNRLDNLALHSKYPREPANEFLDYLKETANKINFDYQKFNELLDIYLNTSNKEDWQKLKIFVNSHYIYIEKEIVKIPNDLNKAYSALRGLIGVENFDNNLQVYDAIILLKDEISSDLIKEIIVQWKEDKEYYLSYYDGHFLDSKVFWSSNDGMWEIDSISMHRFKETFDIKGFDSTFKEVRKELEDLLWEFSPPQNIGPGPFYFWLIDRIPNFFNNYYDTTRFLESIAEEQTTNGYWENKNIIKSQIVDENTHRITYTEYETDTSGTALCSINLIKHSKYDILRDKGIKGVEWLLEEQNSDGSWYDEIRSRSSGEIEKKKSLFTTLLALEALIRSEIPNLKPQIDLAFQWIMSKQNKFGMWEDDEFQPLFQLSSSPLMTVLILELENLLKSYEKQQINPELTSSSSENIPISSYEFDIAVSFAGEDRNMVEKYVSLLKTEAISVFYDKDMKSDLWGKNLVDGLYEIYTSKARYCVMFISKHYLEKMWTNHERQAAQERALKDKSEYILPIKLDDTEIPGLPTTIGYLDLRELTIEKIASETIKKLKNKAKVIKDGKIDKTEEFVQQELELEDITGSVTEEFSERLKSLNHTAKISINQKSELKLITIIQNFRKIGENSLKERNEEEIKLVMSFIREIGKAAAKQRLDNSVQSTSRDIEELLNISINEELDDAIRMGVSALKWIGKAAIAQKLVYASLETVESLGNIGNVLAHEKKGLLSLQAVKSLQKLEEMAEQNDDMEQVSLSVRRFNNNILGTAKEKGLENIILWLEKPLI